MKYQEYMEAVKKADKAMKESNGHSYETILKTRCIYCGRSPKQKGKCKNWIDTFVKCLYEELINL